MSRLVIKNNLSLDGVMQSPSNPDEDRRGGFEHGGWALRGRALMRHRRVDEYVLSIHPLVLGSGRRLFPDGCPFAKLRLVDSVTTTTGVVIGTLEAGS